MMIRRILLVKRRCISATKVIFKVREMSRTSWQANSVFPRLFQHSFYNSEKIAVIDENGSYSYEDLRLRSVELSRQLLTSQKNLDGERIAFLTPNNASYVIATWATWLSGGICVPLCKTYPRKELSYVLDDSKPKIAITTPEYSDIMKELVKPIGADLITITTDFTHEQNITDVGNSTSDRAMLVYTSGTTGPPKGVLWTHLALELQVKMMIKAWEWHVNDTILHVLPLHHVHGIVNALLCPLCVGATVIMKNKFLADEVWDHFLGKAGEYPDVSVFMAVPTIYAKLIEYFENNLTSSSENILKKCQKVRLMVSGSAALPLPVLEKWQEVTSHTLLERYGMSEVGMALTNPYRGKRVAGNVGKPFPEVKAKIVGDQNETIAIGDAEMICEKIKGRQGNLLVKGPIFEKYWKRDQATIESFTEDGWFKTGDTATISDGCFKIVGRTSVDIIKSGGYKIGALQIERHLLVHEDILEVAVLGVPDEIWGERVGAVISLKNGKSTLDVEAVNAFCKPLMPPYNIPTVLKIVDEIPKNAMGKVNKKALVKLF